MTVPERLLLGILEEPDDPAPRLVLADWLEEQDNPASRVRAELLRLQVRYASAGASAADRQALEREATRNRRQKLRMAGSLAGLVRVGTDLLSFKVALPAFLLADYLPAGADPFQPDAVWHGWLGEHRHRYPTTFRVLERQGARFKGNALEDFESYFHLPALVTFWFDGIVVAGEHLVYASTRADGPGICPCLYQLRLRPGGWLVGGWYVEHLERNGPICLRRRHGMT